MKLIRKKSYNEINVIDISQDADVSVGTLYYHFPDGKESILKTIMNQQTGGYVNQFKEKAEKENLLNKKTLRASLKWIFSTIIELRRNDKKILSALQEVILREPDKFDKIIKEFESDSSVSSGLGEFSNVLHALSMRFPDEAISIKGKEDRVIRVIGTLLTNQIIFEDYFGSDDEFIEMLIDILYSVSNSG